jgi:hypothetical protein
MPFAIFSIKLFIFIYLALALRMGFADGKIYVALPECQAALELRSAEPEILSIRSPCPLSLASTRALLSQGLQRAFPSANLPLRALFLGRLIGYPEWSKRLAATAALSKGWDAKHGKPRNPQSHINALARAWLNGEAFPTELQDTFTAWKLRPCIASIEKTLVYPAHEIFTAQALAALRLSPQARLPADALIWLKLAPASESCKP